jgi:hypothetical protein
VSRERRRREEDMEELVERWKKMSSVERQENDPTTSME